MEKKSSIIAIGLTIHNAPVELREKLAVPEAEWPRAIEELCSYPHIEEAAVLSTCNRMEIYVVGLSFHRGEPGRRLVSSASDASPPASLMSAGGMQTSAFSLSSLCGGQGRCKHGARHRSLAALPWLTAPPLLLCQACVRWRSG